MLFRQCVIAVVMAMAFAYPAAPNVDINESGRVLAELNDWRAIMFVQLIVICLLIFALFTVIGRYLKLAEKALEAGTKSAAASNAIVVALSRVEAKLGVEEKGPIT